MGRRVAVEEEINEEDVEEEEIVVGTVAVEKIGGMIVGSSIVGGGLATGECASGARGSRPPICPAPLPHPSVSDLAGVISRRRRQAFPLWLTGIGLPIKAACGDGRRRRCWMMVLMAVGEGRRRRATLISSTGK